MWCEVHFEDGCGLRCEVRVIKRQEASCSGVAMYIRERRLQIVARVQMLLASSGESAVSRRACCR